LVVEARHRELRLWVRRDKSGLDDIPIVNDARLERHPVH